MNVELRFCNEDVFNEHIRQMGERTAQSYHAAIRKINYMENEISAVIDILEGHKDGDPVEALKGIIEK